MELQFYLAGGNKHPPLLLNPSGEDILTEENGAHSPKFILEYIGFVCYGSMQRMDFVDIASEANSEV